MKKLIVVFVLALSISLISMNNFNSEAQNTTNNSSDIPTNLTVTAQNTTNSTSNFSAIFTESSNQSLLDFGKTLSDFARTMNNTLQSENSPLN